MYNSSVPSGNDEEQHEAECYNEASNRKTIQLKTFHENNDTQDICQPCNSLVTGGSKEEQHRPADKETSQERGQ